MKVILIDDVKKLGKKGDIVEVAAGYGRNYLVAKGLAVVESKKSMEILDAQNEQAAEDAAKAKAEAEELKKKLEKMTLEFRVNAGEGGRVFGSVSSKQIVAELRKRYDVTLDKRKILDNHTINTLGTTIIKVDLYKNQVIASIKVHLSAE